MTTRRRRPLPGGTWSLGGSTVTRFGYGALQLGGPGVVGPPADHDGALGVLRTAVERGSTHIDTSGAYGPHVTNELIREALSPYPESLLVATKVGADRCTGRLACRSGTRRPPAAGPGEPAHPRGRDAGPGEPADG